jgi:hypothetical protein
VQLSRSFTILVAVLAGSAAVTTYARAIPPPVGVATQAPATSHDRVPRWKVWLCRPGIVNDYCAAPLATTLVYASGERRVAKVSPPGSRPIDCFYVYPTVSFEHRGNADLRIEDSEREVATLEGARFEEACRVFAPMYRQTTSYADQLHGDSELAYRDVLAAWKDYLAHDNHGRGVVLIGHSQGAFVLRELIQKEMDGPASRERRLLVSAILVGGNIVVANGSDVGGDFKHVPVCRSATQTGCVVAYSSWGRTPPKDAAFEWVDDAKSQHVVCVNPAAPGGGSAPITPLFPWWNPVGIIPGGLDPPATTLWIGLPGLYTARCVRRGPRAWLLVTALKRPGDPRPIVREALRPSWGLHAADVNIAAADLVALVRSQGKAWTGHHR